MTTVSLRLLLQSLPRFDYDTIFTYEGFGVSLMYLKDRNEIRLTPRKSYW